MDPSAKKQPYPKDPMGWVVAAFEKGDLSVSVERVGDEKDPLAGDDREGILLRGLESMPGVVLESAAREGRLDILQKALAKGLNQTELDTALKAAARDDQVEAMAHLIEAGANIHASDWAGHEAPLRLAAAQGANKAVVWLMDHGANPATSDWLGAAGALSAALSGELSANQAGVGGAITITTKNDEPYGGDLQPPTVPKEPPPKTAQIILKRLNREQMSAWVHDKPKSTAGLLKGTAANVRVRLACAWELDRRKNLEVERVRNQTTELEP